MYWNIYLKSVKAKLESKHKSQLISKIFERAGGKELLSIILFLFIVCLILKFSMDQIYKKCMKNSQRTKKDL